MKKELIRERYKEARNTLSAKELNDVSIMIKDILFLNFHFHKKKVSLFLPIVSQNEINTTLILDELLSQGNKVAIPKTIPKECNLEHYTYESPNQIQISKFGIPEPLYGDIVKPEDFDFVIIPLLAVDKHGYRVGYGKGYYDRFLSQCNANCVFIGLHLFDNFVEIDDVNSYDIQLNYCITPNNLITFDAK